jgi:hypothetical protein
MVFNAFMVCQSCGVIQVRNRRTTLGALRRARARRIHRKNRGFCATHPRVGSPTSGNGRHSRRDEAIATLGEFFNGPFRRKKIGGKFSTTSAIVA